jgi:hypothetical protein
MSNKVEAALHGADHYFQFSTTWQESKRLCGECKQPYAEGPHIEITKLRSFTSYVCPTGGGYGHSSTWTGAYALDGRRLRDHLCICGEEFVEEDSEQWRLSWEHVGPFSDDWVPVTNTQSRHAAKQQHEGLLQLIAEGERIRNVTLEQVSA